MKRLLAIGILLALALTVQAETFNATYEHLEDMLTVQQYGSKCYTPGGWCWLIQPLPLGVYCCCPTFGICGYVGY